MYDIDIKGTHSSYIYVCIYIKLPYLTLTPLKAVFDKAKKALRQ